MKQLLSSVSTTIIENGLNVSNFSMYKRNFDSIFII